LPVPHRTVAAVAMSSVNPLVALASASTDGAGGDAMLGIYRQHRRPSNASSLWTVNDMCRCAEILGPLFTHALLRGGRHSTVSLEATEYPWNQPGIPPVGEDTAVYEVRRSATLVVLGGGMRVVGRATSARPGYPDLWESVWDWSCIGSDGPVGAPDGGNCSLVGSDVLLAKAGFSVPRDHPGVVMFVAKTRVQAGQDDAGGTAALWLEVDGVRRGSVGAQELAAPSTIRQRTLSASYLAAGAQRLSPGRHTVEVHGRIDGSFYAVAFSRDLPLLWFD